MMYLVIFVWQVGENGDPGVGNASLAAKKPAPATPKMSNSQD